MLKPSKEDVKKAAIKAAPYVAIVVLVGLNIDSYTQVRRWRRMFKGVDFVLKLTKDEIAFMKSEDVAANFTTSAGDMIAYFTD